jgi:hypothetical protein
MNLKGRLEKLERGEDLAAHNAERTRPRQRSLERLLHAHENGRREIQGLEPLPELPYTEEDAFEDRRFLEETIPAYRERPGWQSEEAKAVLDRWEQHIRDNLAKGADDA